MVKQYAAENAGRTAYLCVISASLISILVRCVFFSETQKAQKDANAKDFTQVHR